MGMQLDHFNLGSDDAIPRSGLPGEVDISCDSNTRADLFCNHHCQVLLAIVHHDNGCLEKWHYLYG